MSYGNMESPRIAQSYRSECKVALSAVNFIFEACNDSIEASREEQFRIHPVVTRNGLSLFTGEFLFRESVAKIHPGADIRTVQLKRPAIKNFRARVVVLSGMYSAEVCVDIRRRFEAANRLFQNKNRFIIFLQLSLDVRRPNIQI